MGVALLFLTKDAYIKFEKTIVNCKSDYFEVGGVFDYFCFDVFVEVDRFVANLLFFECL